MTQTIEIEIPGKPLTGNMQSRMTVMRMAQGSANHVYRARMYKTSAAASYQAMVYGLAFEAAANESWIMPFYAVVELDYYNIRADVDGIPKLVLDGLQGAFYANDSRIKQLLVRAYKDLAGQRIIVRVRGMTWAEAKSRGLSVPVKQRI